LEKHEAKDGDKLLLCYSPIVLPVSFVKHLYFVLVKNGTPIRYEVFGVGEIGKEEGYIKKNYFMPYEGIRYFFSFDPKKTGKRFETKVLHVFDASDIDESRIIAFNNDYPYRYQYSYPGPNSNTYVSWMLGRLALEADLPITAFGKGHKVQ